MSPSPRYSVGTKAPRSGCAVAKARVCVSFADAFGKKERQRPKPLPSDRKKICVSRRLFSEIQHAEHADKGEPVADGGRDGEHLIAQLGLYPDVLWQILAAAGLVQCLHLLCRGDGGYRRL